MNLPDEGEDDHEELEEGDGHDDKVDGGGVDPLVDLARRVHKGQVVPVNCNHTINSVAEPESRNYELRLRLRLLSI